MKESNVQQLVRMEASKLGAITWRNNTGVLKDENGRPVRYGLCNGSADLIGIYKGQFLAIEVKTAKGKARDNQLNFLQVVRDNGGIAGIARSPECVKKILDGDILS
jgi:hypothetical protein